MSKYASTDAFPDEYVNPRGIPRVPFISDMADYVKQRGVGIEAILRSLSEQHSKYKLMEHKLTQNLGNLEGKIPEITKTLEALAFLKKKSSDEETLSTNFALTDLVFCEANVPPQTTVHLWLGANVMVEYPIDDAVALLTKNLAAAKLNLTNTQEDLAWLRDQQVVCEVNSSRLYNWDVVRRRNEGGADVKK